MIEAKAISRCEVKGVPYNPGDSMMLTRQEFEDLSAQGAAVEVVAKAVPQPPRPVHKVAPKKG